MMKIRTQMMMMMNWYGFSLRGLALHGPFPRRL